LSFIPTITLIAGGAVLGFTGWILNGILDDFVVIGIHQTGNVYDFIFYVWAAVFVIYWIFGGMWAIRRYNEREYGGI
jgi:uncharacterized membrane protein